MAFQRWCSVFKYELLYLICLLLDFARLGTNTFCHVWMSQKTWIDVTIIWEPAMYNFPIFIHGWLRTTLFFGMAWSWVLEIVPNDQDAEPIVSYDETVNLRQHKSGHTVLIFCSMTTGKIADSNSSRDTSASSLTYWNCFNGLTTENYRFRHEGDVKGLWNRPTEILTLGKKLVKNPSLFLV